MLEYLFDTGMEYGLSNRNGQPLESNVTNMSRLTGTGFQCIAVIVRSSFPVYVY
jgi:hypothetical protein